MQIVPILKLELVQHLLPEAAAQLLPEREVRVQQVPGLTGRVTEELVPPLKDSKQDQLVLPDVQFLHNV